jgi:hypothetical protein
MQLWRLRCPTVYHLQEETQESQWYSSSLKPKANKTQESMVKALVQAWKPENQEHHCP